jgi:hypothetical protein
MDSGNRSPATSTTRRVIEMTRRKSILGALLLCALAVCAFGAASASAEGLTAYTCTEGTGADEYSDSHCLVENPGAGPFATVKITEPETAVTIESVSAPKLTATIALSKITVECESSMSEGGTITNKVGPPMSVEGKNGRAHYTNCRAFLQSNPEKACTVKNKIVNENVGTITTTVLKSTTEFSATEHFIKFEPQEGTKFAEFILENGLGTCPAALIGSNVQVTGAARGRVPTSPHSHITFDATSGSTLKAGGAAATYDATERVTMAGTEKTIGLTTGA